MSANNVRVLHAPKKRTAMPHGDVQPTGEQVAAYLAQLECAHCRKPYPCATITALDFPLGVPLDLPGDDAAQSRAVARLIESADVNDPLAIEILRILGVQPYASWPEGI